MLFKCSNYKSLSCVHLLSITFNWEFITNIKLPSMMTVICNVITYSFQSKLKRSYFNEIIRIITKTIILIIRERKTALQRVDKNWNNYCNNRYFLSGLSLAAVIYEIATHESSIILFMEGESFRENVVYAEGARSRVSMRNFFHVRKIVRCY